MIHSKKPVFAPAEVDTSIRPGWFFHPEQTPHSLEHLQNVYLNSVGRNACLNLNIPPMPNGRFHPDDVMRLREFGSWIQNTFSEEKNLMRGAEVSVTALSETQRLYDIRFGEKKKITYAELCEDISQGQRVSSFAFVKDLGHDFIQRFYDDTTIGHKKICKLDTETDTLKFLITGARDVPLLKSLRIFGE